MRKPNGSKRRAREKSVQPVRSSDSGLVFRRVFTVEGRDPLDAVVWQKRTAAIRNEKNELIFEQTDIETPEFWSDMALTVVASRYFRGTLSSEERETSVKSLLTRVVDTIAVWGTDQGYFASPEDARVFRDELLFLVLHQKASFNSPVWFNIGADPHPQCSACFIISVDDTMESILQWYTQEGIIFKGGSGSGVNVSKLRSCREPLSGGGLASGPLSFMKAADASAGVIRSGGKTRRAAKMVILDIDHPDIVAFIRSKALEEKKVQALVNAGYDGSLEGEAYSTVAFQNSNHSVRVTDEFMRAVETNGKWQTRFVASGKVADTYPAGDLMREMALAAHACGDPGIQFHTTINRWHTCPETAPIRASNPCSEYMHVDDSACNLASLKLTAFADKNGFDTEAFRHAVDIMITAQDIIVDKASYPTPAITRNSRNLRALGLGYADLGALLMSMGLPYDSDEGRAWASGITALMTGEAYSQSARIAAVRGPFSEFEKNREPMLGVIRAHSDKASMIDGPALPKPFLEEIKEVWDAALALGSAHGYANCQVTVIAPTGTVAFMMDCDTTGLEPELALIKYKSLSGGGRLEIVNRTVPRALERLGYSTSQVNEITVQLAETGSLEHIPELAQEHLPVFDCAFRPLKGKRNISPEGHIRMMAAVQPFVSGAISKTVNLPNDASVEMIERIFTLAWRLGLKSIAVYRDGCKAVQPVVTSQALFESQPVRKRLPVDCKSFRHKFEVAGQKGYIHVGFYEDGKVGEIFIRMAKEGSTISGLMDTIATLTSISLQYGVPLEALVNKFSHVRFEPSGFTSNREIPIAKSLTDYIFRFLGIRFLNKDQQVTAGLLPPGEGNPNSGVPASGGDQRTQTAYPFHLQSDAPACHDCGAIMVREGSCYNCLNCGATSGCS
ncbi:vitamin B12-dependent ribonucleotide reductase [Desulfomonile tiedjei]|uniref:Vitamin B12-dependent ribonucleotide reductase n=1 Tax=Desulfomonile tiedjei (strain ATCC 49306 / DSM 6799 / DCB-1) TaxID=706587 RepID=I4CA58_DESTA|nr:vitamin B12-dependent ribonucleotide reductase [Desulfomonile tiedjei]AFM26449.1 ribonucleoside-diphosphate reductase class II [Desulfomonile tiedjei DSM 6799]